MLIKKPNKIQSSEITPESVYVNRRKFVQSALAAGTLMAAGTACSKKASSTDDVLKNVSAGGPPEADTLAEALGEIKPSRYSTSQKQNAWRDITTYNNFYEFGLGKSDPVKNAGSLSTDPWSVTVSGEADVTGTFAFEDFVKPHTLEERIYRLRCVEAWSMVIPWVGISLADVIKRLKPNSKARSLSLKHCKIPSRCLGNAVQYSTGRMLKV